MRTTEEIYRALAERMAQASGIAAAEGGDLSLRLRAVAAELYTLEAQAEFTQRQSFPQTAQGEYLDRHASLRGLSRNPAEKAQGTLCFSIDSARASALQVPAGTECRTAAGTAFLTVEDGEIAAGETSCTVAAEAALPGSGGNVPAGAVCLMILPPTGVQTVTNTSAFSGGCDEEDDEALRQRVLSSYRRLPNGANAAYYENKVMDCPGTAAVLVLPRSRGVGTVDIVFSTESGIPTDAEIAAVQTVLESEREICVDLQVEAPTAETVNVSAELTAAEGYGSEEVCAAAEAAVAGYFSGRLLGKPVYRAGLEALLMGVDGVENCCLTVPAADLAAESGVLPVLGTVLLTAAEE